MTMNAHFSPFSRTNSTSGEKAVSQPVINHQASVNGPFSFHPGVQPQTDAVSFSATAPFGKSTIRSNVSLHGTQARAKQALSQVSQYYPELSIAEAAQKSA